MALEIKASSLVCPECGFRIFNRRYPKCEFCGAALPEPLVYSAEELAALWAKEKLEYQANKKNRKLVVSESDNSSAFVWYSYTDFSGGDPGCGGGCDG